MNKSLLLLLIILGGINRANCSEKNTNTYIDQGLQAKEFFYNIPNTPKSFQLFSHGRAGELLIKGKWLTAPQVAAWLKKSKLLKEAIHLNIYACEFGKGEKGMKAVAYLQKSLGITVAASNNITGANGDWSLETGTGKDVLQFPAYPHSLQNEFITTWEVTAGDLGISIPTDEYRRSLDNSVSYNYNVDWGDGTPSSTNQTGNATHTYASPGVYTVKISGKFPAIYFNDGREADKIKSIEQWGNIEWLSMYYAFYGCSNLTIKDGIAPPNLSKVTNMEGAFKKASSFTGRGINNWDVSNVANMSSMFSEGIQFDADLSAWNVGQVTNMFHMFFQADIFQADLSKWDVSNVTNMSTMFTGADKFNSDLSKWDVSNVTDMSYMFYGADKFDSDLSKWDVSNVTNMSTMFTGADKFNSDLSKWDVSNVTDMSYMFYGADKFDSDLSTWNVSNVIDMVGMFWSAFFFRGKGVNNWDVSNVTDMSAMFFGSKKFDSDLSTWDVSNVTDMSYMFSWIDLFQGVGLSNWDVYQVSDMDEMLSGLTISPDIYTTILNSWAAQSVKSNVKFDGGYSKYCDESGRNILVSKGWRITDGGKIASIAIDLGSDIDNCPGIPVTLDAGSHSGVTYLWNTGETSQTISVNTLGAFSVEVSSASGCVARDTILVKDNLPPVAPGLSDVTGECSATAIVPTTTDNCSGTITGSTTDPLTYTTEGIHIINWTFDDGNGNSITVSQNVIVYDVTDPDVPVLSDLTGECGFTAVAPTTTDNCSGTITGTTTDPLTYTTQGTHIINWTFDDGNGNSITVAQNVIVDDITDPVRPTLADVIGECTATAPVPTTSDNCSGTITGITSDPLSYNIQGTYVINWTFDDGNGNSITVPQNVIVDDVTAPVRPTLADVIGECTATAPVPTTSDNCSGTITGTTTDLLTYTTQGTHAINWIFDDGNGNSITVAQNVIVDDITDPVRPTLADVIGECTATAVVPTTSDNCSGTITGSTTDPLTYTTEGIHIINWTFDDGNGNSITVAQNVIVDDITDPVRPTLVDVIGECTATAPVPTTSDNCSGTITGTTTDLLTYTTQGTHAINWTFDDGNGNVITVPQNVIVDDVTAPIVPILNDVSGMCTVDLSVPIANDNCSGSIPGTTSDPLTYDTEGSYVVNWTFDDGNGNISGATQNVDVFTIVEDVELSSSATELTCDVNKIDLITDAKVQGKALYKWFKDGDLISGETSFVLEVGNGKEGEYVVEVSDENLHCNVLSNPVLITENVTAPTVYLSPLSGSLTTAETIVITTTVTSRGNAGYLWTTGETTSAIEVKLPGKYSVEVTDSANGCRVNSSDTGQEAIITNYWKDNIPKAFTPNADGYNDSWNIERIELARNLKIVIYNRWGKALYKFSGTGNEYKGTPWKGVDGNTNLPIGSYYYAIEIDDKKPILGTVTITR